MKKIIGASKWLIHNFFSIAIAIFIVIYLLWFQLTPLMFYNDPDYAYIVGLILLGLYCLFVIFVKFSKSRTRLKILLLIPTALLFFGVVIHMYTFFPSVEDITECNGKAYYITWMHPFGDYQWVFNNVTIWKNTFSYESFFLSYSGSYKAICDNKNSETHIVQTGVDR